jgi:hypothetical protein
MNVRLSFILIVIAAFVSALPDASVGQTTTAAPQSIQVDVVYLSADLLEGRETGTRGEESASMYIADRFKGLGLSPAGTDGWFQSFPVISSSNPHATAADGEKRTGRNVIGFLDNGAATTVVIGAHYDHLGFGGNGSREPGVVAIHNGADDNASGVAGLLEIARELLASSARNNNYLFIAFSGEELGLYGSKSYVSSALRRSANLNYMINLDMIGRLDQDRSIAVSGTGTSPSWGPALAAVGSDLKINQHESGLGPSDHASFYLDNVPVLHLFTGQHEDYHKPSDDSQLINYEGIYRVAAFTIKLIQKLNGEGKLAFEKTVDEQQARTAFKVSMGIMPDYVSSDDGVRIDAVMDGRPAAKAGLMKGDVIVKLGDVDVVDMSAYMVALSKLEEGASAEVVVRRGEELVKKTVQF